MLPLRGLRAALSLRALTGLAHAVSLLSASDYRHDHVEPEKEARLLRWMFLV